MIDYQIAQLQALQDNAETILNRQVAEAEDKANRLFEENERKKAEMKAAIDRSRALQVQRRQQERAMAKKEEIEFAEFWRIRNEELSLAEQQEKEEDRQRNIELANFIKSQNEKKNALKVQEFMENADAAAKAQALLDQQEKNFYSYAEQCINQWQA